MDIGRLKKREISYPLLMEWGYHKFSSKSRTYGRSRTPTILSWVCLFAVTHKNTVETL